MPDPAPAVFPTDFRAGLVRDSDNGWCWILGDRMRPVIDSRTTGGGFDLFESHTAWGAGPPPHLHTGADEMFIVQSGRMRFLLDRDWITAGLGDVVYVPRHTVHTFRGADKNGSRMLIHVSPGNFSAFVQEASTPECDCGPTGVAPSEAVIGKLMADCSRHDIDMQPTWETNGEWDEGL